jgi:hypothetical protein
MQEWHTDDHTRTKKTIWYETGRPHLPYMRPNKCKNNTGILNQSINREMERPINQLINQSTNQSFIRSVNRPIT